MGLVQSSWPLCWREPGRCWEVNGCAGILSVEPDECRLLLLAFEVCVLLWSRTMQKPNGNLPWLPHDYSFGNFLRCVRCANLGKACFQEILLVSETLWHHPMFYSPSQILRFSRYNGTLNRFLGPVIIILKPPLFRIKGSGWSCLCLNFFHSMFLRNTSAPLGIEI